MPAAVGKKSQLNGEIEVKSIPNYVIKKNPSHGARQGPTEKQRTCHKAHNTLRKAQKKGHNTRLERFLNDPVCRESQSNIGWDENTCNTYDEIAKEDHSSVATRGERSRNENSWRLVLNAESANGPLDQRDDHQETKETCNKLYKEYAAAAGCGNTTIHPQQRVREKPNQQFEGHEEDSYRLDSSTGWKN